MKKELKDGGAIQQRLIDTRAELATQEETGAVVFQHGVLCQVGLPRSRQVGRTFERTYKFASVRVEAGALWNGKTWMEQPLPFGAKPRLALFYINSQAVRTGSRFIEIGNSYKEFCERLQLPTDGNTFYDLRKQMQALAAARLTIGFTAEGRASTIDAKPIERFDAWLSTDGRQATLWPANLELSAKYHADLLQHAVPMPVSAVAALSHSALALDQLAFLARRLPDLNRPVRVPFVEFKEQFGQEYRGKNATKDFRRDFLNALKQVLTVYDGARIEQVTGGLVLKPSPPMVRKAYVNGYSLPVAKPRAIGSGKADKGLTERTSTEFKDLWPSLDVKACKADFDAWLKGAPEQPKNYQRAFMGFARKWSHGKG